MPSESDALIPCISFAAKSTEDKAGSIPTQLADNRAMAEQVGGYVVAEYTDENASAWSGNRGPGLKAAMEHAEQLAREHGRCYLIVQHSDRLARGDARQARHLVEVVTWAVKAGVTIRSVQDDLFADERMSVLMGALMGMRNTEDSERKSKATRAGKRRRAERGGFNGSGRPYGYQFAGDGGPLAIDEAEAAIVRRIFAEKLAGHSQVAIARGLEEDGVPTATGKGRWRQSRVAAIVRNPLYVGQIEYEPTGETFDGIHEAIIDAATWTKAQSLLASRGPSKGRGRPPKARHIFRDGRLRCGNCGESMAARTPVNERREPHYICSRRLQLGPDACSMPPLPRKLVDEPAVDFFMQVGWDREATYKRYREAHNQQLAEARSLVEQNKGEATRLDGERERIERDYRAGDLSAPNYERIGADIAEERRAVVSKGKQLRKRLAEVESCAEIKDAEREVLEWLAEVRKAIIGEVQNAEGPDAIRVALDRLFASFVVNMDENGEFAVTPKRRREIVFKVEDPAHFPDDADPADWINLTPSRVPLELAEKIDRQPTCPGTSRMPPVVARARPAPGPCG